LAIKIIKLSPTIDQNKRKLKLDILSSGMLMQAAEVRSTAMNLRSTAEEHCVFVRCARTQARCVRTQQECGSFMQVRSTATWVRSTATLHCFFVREAVLARRRVMSSHAGANVLGLAAVRSTARTAFDRTVCTLNFPETEQNTKNNLKKKIN
jgi:hypothetical protein